MPSTAQEVISLFRNKGSELSTSQILENIDENYAKLREKLNSHHNNPSIKRQIAQIHRKALYHLNKLTEIGILAIVKHGEKGEKFFSLKIGDDEEIIEISSKYKKRIIASGPAIPPMPIEGYEQKEIVLKYEPATWIDRLNSVIVFSEKIKDKEQLYDILTENVFPVVNDAISLENFESILNEHDITDFLEKINKECEDYGKLLNITINLSELQNKENFIKLLDLFSKNKLGNINFIFALDNNDLEECFNLISRTIETFSKNKITLYIKNKNIQKAPYFVGRAGPYRFIDKEWNLAEELRKKALCLGCSQSTAIVDVDKFYAEHGLDIEKFSQLMFNISKSMLSANSIQRRKSEECFKSVNELNKGYEAEFLSLSRNYIRFWNFGLSQPGINPEFMLNMINEAKKKIDEFAAAEETIYKSCGMTTRFKLALSCAFETASKLSPAKYTRFEIKDFNDLYKKEIKQTLLAREEVCQIFDGGDEVTFHYSGELNPDNITRQISIILSNFKIPLFNYSFENMKGNLKLTHFM